MGISRTDFARTYGFGISTDDAMFAAATRAANADPNAEYQNGLSEEQRLSFSNSMNACRDEVAEELASPPQFLSAIDAMVERVLSDPRVIEAQRGWSDCMAELGLAVRRFVTPDDLTAWLYSEVDRVESAGGDLDSLRAVEIELAVRNLECEPQLRGVMRQVALEYESAVTSEYADVLGQLRDMGNG